MDKKFRVLVCEFHQETDTFNPIPYTLDRFAHTRHLEGAAFYDACKSLRVAAHGMFDAIEEFGGEVIPTVGMFGACGGRVTDDVLEYLTDKVKEYMAEAGEFDAVFASLHGATCADSVDDVCGVFVERLRKMIGDEKVIAASFDLHGNITDRMMKNADVVCGYQTYPHVDFYETGYRAGMLGMRKLMKKPQTVASVSLPMLVPPAGYSTLESPFKEVMDYAKSLIANGTLLDFSIFQVQAWLDIEEIGGRIIAVAEDPEVAKKYAVELANLVYKYRDGYWPDFKTIDEIIDRAEDPESVKPVILVDSADSPNGGAVGDSVAVAMRVYDRGSKLRVGMFVKDPEAVKKAFEVGVGNTAEFSIGAKFTPNMPGPLVAVGKVRSLHDGDFAQEGPASKGLVHHIGLSAVISIGNMDIMVCNEPTGSGDPQLIRHFGIEPTLYDLIVVKANTSFRVPYSKFATEMYCADSPGAGASNLKWFEWKHAPQNIYPFTPNEDYVVTSAVIHRD